MPPLMGKLKIQEEGALHSSACTRRVRSLLVIRRIRRGEERGGVEV